MNSPPLIWYSKDRLAQLGIPFGIPNGIPKALDWLGLNETEKDRKDRKWLIYSYF
jgi:hypothetical protein